MSSANIGDDIWAAEDSLLSDACTRWSEDELAKASNLVEVLEVCEVKKGQGNDVTSKTQSNYSRHVQSRPITAINDIAKGKHIQDYEKMGHLRAATAYPYSKQCLINKPSTFTAQDIDNRNCTARMAYHCGKPLVTERDECWRVRCTAKVDAMGDRLLNCRFPVGDRNHPMSIRHNKVVTILTKWLNKAGYSAKDEECNPEAVTRDRPDITVKEGTNIFAFVEVMVTTLPPAGHRSSPVIRNSRKTKKYEELSKRRERNSSMLFSQSPENVSMMTRPNYLITLRGELR